MLSIKKQIRSLESWGKEEELIADYIKKKFQGEQLKILEAGCGTKWDQAELLSGVDYTLTGIDLDDQALDFRKNNLKDLDETICGDLRKIDFLKAEFDVIFNSFVLEHIDGAEEILQNFDKWLKPGGLIILRIPDPATVYGFFSKVTPFWAHGLYAKYFKELGKPGHTPYPTEFDEVVSQDGIRKFCAERNWTIKEEIINGYYHQESLYSAASKMSKVISLLTFNKLKDTHTNLLYVLEKN